MSEENLLYETIFNNTTPPDFHHIEKKIYESLNHSRVIKVKILGMVPYITKEETLVNDNKYVTEKVFRNVLANKNYITKEEVLALIGEHVEFHH
jgi:hypothetical protein